MNKNEISLIKGTFPSEEPNEEEEKAIKAFFKSRKGNGKEFARKILDYLIESRYKFLEGSDKTRYPGYIRWRDLKKLSENEKNRISNQTLSRLLGDFEKAGIIRKYTDEQEKGKPHIYYVYTGNFPKYYFKTREELISEVNRLQEIYLKRHIAFDFAIEMLEENGVRDARNIIFGKTQHWIEKIFCKPQWF